MRTTDVFYSGEEPIPENKAHAIAVFLAIDDEINDHLENQSSRIWASLAVGGGVFLLCFLLVISQGMSIIYVTGMLVGGAIAGGGYWYTQNLNPEVTVTGIKKGYWTGYKISKETGTYLFDATNGDNQINFELEILTDQETVSDVKTELENINELPILETEDNYPEKEFEAKLEKVNAALDQTKSHNVVAPIIANEETVQSIDRLSERSNEKPIRPKTLELERDEAFEKVDRLIEFEKMIDEDHGESILQDIDEEITTLSRELSGLQETSIELLNDHIQKAGDLLGRLSYNFYCLSCAEEGMDSKLQYQPEPDQWYCQTCRSKFHNGEGVPKHKIRDDLIFDITHHLWTEKDDEKRRIYENIDDRKSELREKEFEEKQATIREISGRIKDLRHEISDLRTEAKAKREAINRISSLMVKYERLNDRRKEQFREDVSEAFDEIDKETEEILEETRAIEERRMKEAEEKAKEKEKLRREEEQALKRELTAIRSSIEDQNKEIKDMNEKLNEMNANMETGR